MFWLQFFFLFFSCQSCAGNVLSILATERVGVAVAYPIFQCGLLVAGECSGLCLICVLVNFPIAPDYAIVMEPTGLWGILIFDELERPCIPAYLLSGLALVLGAVFLAMAK